MRSSNTPALPPLWRNATENFEKEGVSIAKVLKETTNLKWNFRRGAKGWNFKPKMVDCFGYFLGLHKLKKRNPQEICKWPIVTSSLHPLTHLRVRTNLHAKTRGCEMQFLHIPLFQCSAQKQSRKKINSFFPSPRALWFSFSTRVTRVPREVSFAHSLA